MMPSPFLSWILFQGFRSEVPGICLHGLFIASRDLTALILFRVGQVEQLQVVEVLRILSFHPCEDHVVVLLVQFSLEGMPMSHFLLYGAPAVLLQLVDQLALLLFGIVLSGAWSLSTHPSPVLIPWPSSASCSD